ncbi:hypothetical protein Poli38472_013281 [Pythium oligandrum]|uniref:t-SNARE coiled-coil homology domain-containing protein n=1 Tax=Pythium oligandrum TaxID=41045 RepID=A0A8K1C2R4_PYTOL|nr:hypothetical protein Poli38472_013281 [Pythium oligandrum]|eukprot:TMW55390.1 hypothetical protein Poli38472_013281 [Pythium oligandrum]
MSFADFAGGNKTTTGMTGTMGRTGVGMSGPLAGAKPNKHVEAATLKLEQFQRQVLAIKRAAADASTHTMTRKNSASGSAFDDDLHDRIRFACLLQEEIAKTLKLIPQDATNSLIQRKLIKDFEAISGQLERAVVQISAREQEMQDTLMQEKESHQGKIVVEHQGEMIEFEELENEIAHNEALIEEREKDIEKIHQSVAQVHEIFRDLATIVQEQQTAIDEIETHVHESLEQTQQGLEQVKKASEAQGYCVIQ